jgi:hypothetical protein
MNDKSKLGVMIERVQLNKNPIELVYSHIRYEYLPVCTQCLVTARVMM